ncbi:hypothetical protein MTR_2g060610 [Medicago truncatula]|uniref:Uncharacterized protein n=1 Tax=Medicago truncatula TaxID=3880 RepID=G7IIZ2_MEDTR|nr:hypothetical protein MTR_2g060610 [Medicago truncatula]
MSVEKLQPPKTVAHGMLEAIRELRHSLAGDVVDTQQCMTDPTQGCANAALKCQMLILTIVQRFTVGNFEIQSSRIKSVKLLKRIIQMFDMILVKVLAWLERKTCLEFIKNGYFNAMT